MESNLVVVGGEGGRGVGGEGRGEGQEKEEENGWRFFWMCGL